MLLQYFYGGDDHNIAVGRGRPLPGTGTGPEQIAVAGMPEGPPEPLPEFLRHLMDCPFALPVRPLCMGVP